MLMVIGRSAVAWRPSGEALVRLAERGLRVEPGIARRRHDIEEKLAEEFLIADVEREVETRGLDLHAGSALEHALRGEQGGELARDAAE